MDKMEKVVKGLECCLSTDLNDCTPMRCPYFGFCGGHGAPDEMLHDAFDLLKAQEPVRPVHDTSYGARPWWFVCGNCKLSVDEDQKYCPNCGRAVKWK